MICNMYAIHLLNRVLLKISLIIAGFYEPEFTLSRGEFDVLLCVDNTETTGGGAGGRSVVCL